MRLPRSRRPTLPPAPGSPPGPPTDATWQHGTPPSRIRSKRDVGFYGWPWYTWGRAGEPRRRPRLPRRRPAGRQLRGAPRRGGARPGRPGHRPRGGTVGPGAGGTGPGVAMGAGGSDPTVTAWTLRGAPVLEALDTLAGQLADLTSGSQHSCPTRTAPRAPQRPPEVLAVHLAETTSAPGPPAAPRAGTAARRGARPDGYGCWWSCGGRCPVSPSRPSGRRRSGAWSSRASRTGEGYGWAPPDSGSTSRVAPPSTTRTGTPQSCWWRWQAAP